MDELMKVVKYNGVDVVASFRIAEELDIHHKNLLDLIEKHLPTIETEFGRVAFETYTFQTAGGPQKTRIALLSEDQSLFVGTLSRNSEKVVRFKVKLVKSFQSARKAVEVAYSIPATYAQALQLAADQATIIERQNLQIESDKPKVAFADAVSTSETEILMRDLAKLIAQNGYVIGEHRLYDWMVQGGYLERRKRWSPKKEKHEIQYWPTQRAVELKVFRVKETVIHEGSSSAFLKPTVKILPKGQTYFINKFLSH